jgi:hypothetical protein
MLASVCSGCFSISVAPSCPSELGVGETGAVWANEENTGAIPTYKWEVEPTDAGTFQNPDQPSTNFTAQKAGDAIIRLTAADGLYQVVSRCTTRILFSGTVGVLLTVDPSPITIGENAILFCSSTGEITPTTLSLAQTAGPDVMLMPLSQGVATFTPQQAATLSFQCVGQSADGQTSAPSTVTVVVEEEGRGGGRR